MAHNKLTVKGLPEKSEDEHALLQQEDFRWIGELRDVLSPYWSARLTTQRDSQHPGVLFDEMQKEKRG